MTKLVVFRAPYVRAAASGYRRVSRKRTGRHQRGAGFFDVIKSIGKAVLPVAKVALPLAAQAVGGLGIRRKRRARRV